MTTLRRKRHRTTDREVPRAKRGASAPPGPDLATTLPQMPAVAAKKAEAVTQPEIKRPSKAPAARRSTPSIVTKPLRSASTKPELPLAKRRTRPSAPAVHVSIAPSIDAPPASIHLPTPDPVAARYSVIPRRGGTEARFPTLAQYTEALPHGLASYPSLRAKGALVRRLLLDPVHPLPLGVGLPPRLEELIRMPPSVNDWVPLVDLCALHGAAFDSAFATKGGISAYEEWTFQRDLQLFKSPLYRALIAVDRPERLLANHAARWSAFHRGSTLNVMAVAEGKVTLRLAYPPYSWPKISRVALGAAFRAAVIVAGASSGEVTSKEESISLSSFEIRWQ